LRVALNYLVGAGLADPEGVRVVETPFEVFVAEPTESLDGRDGVVEVVTRRVGMRVGVSSAKSEMIKFQA